MKRQNVVEIRLTAARARELVRSISNDTANVQFTQHAQERMRERDIVDVDVFRVLRNGYVDDDPTQLEHDRWQCKVTLKIRGGRVAGVVTIILMRGKLRIRTVEWED
jgi:glycine cleavage system H lipoate-binding protein